MRRPNPGMRRLGGFAAGLALLADSAGCCDAVPGAGQVATVVVTSGIAIVGGSVWAAGTYVDPVTDNNNALVLREAGGSWAIAGAPNPGSGSNLPGSLTVINGRLWLAGVYDNGDSRLPLIASS
jgi:hypothetical protein